MWLHKYSQLLSVASATLEMFMPTFWTRWSLLFSTQILKLSRLSKILLYTNTSEKWMKYEYELLSKQKV